MTRVRRPTRSPSPLHRPDWVTVGIWFGLALLGLLMIFNASNIEAYYDFGDKFHFVKLQFAWLGLGTIIWLLTSFLPLPWIKKLSPYLFISALLLLLIVLIPIFGVKVQGARRWLYLGSFSLQPSEWVKVVSVVYFPALVLRRSEPLPFILAFCLLVGLIILEPDFGTAVIVSTIAASVYFSAHTPLKHLLGLGSLTLVAAAGLILISPYRLERVKTFLDPTRDPLGADYHIRQVLISLGSGGLTGSGFGRSRQKYQYLPEATTDSIFAVTAEEIGFIGASVVLFTYALALIRGFQIALNINKPYAQLVAVAVLSWFGAQTLVNLGAMVALIPLTGIPLPFLSYGGSSLLAVMAGLGLYTNASRYRK